MADSYDPTTAAITTDASIGSTTYIVTAFSDSGASAVGPDFQNSDGSNRGARRVKGPRNGSMTIEIESASQGIPEQFSTFTYDASVWCIFEPAKAVSSTAAGTYSLSLRWVSAAV